MDRLLLGRYSLSRLVLDSGSRSVLHRASGTAEIKRLRSANANTNTSLCPSDILLVYQEHGHIQLTQQYTIPFHKQYLYVIRDEQLQVWFLDDPHNMSIRFFHHARHGERDTHLCGQDTYNAHYVFKDSGDIEFEYVISGPEKNMTIETKLMKLMSDQVNEE